MFCTFPYYLQRATLFQRPSLQLSLQWSTPRVTSGSLCGSFEHLPLCSWPTSRRGSRSDELYTHCANRPPWRCGAEKLGLVGQTMWYHFQQPIFLSWFLCKALYKESCMFQKMNIMHLRGIINWNKVYLSKTWELVHYGTICQQTEEFSCNNTCWKMKSPFIE